MANEKKDKNEAIPMGGSKTDGTKVVVKKSDDTALAEINNKPEKKVNAATIVILAITALLIVSAVSVGVLFALATTDTMPKAPLVTTDMSTVVKDSAIEMIKDQKITFTSDEVNLFLKTLVEKSADKLESNGVQIKDLFVVIADDKATLYCRAKYKGITWPIKAVVNISYDDPYVVIGFSSAYVGKLELSTDKLMGYVDKNLSSDDISIHNSFIYYDTTTFNDKLSDMTLEALGLTAEDITSDANDSSDDEEEFFLSKWWNNFIKGIYDSIRNWAAGVVSDFIHEIHFDDVKIINNEIVINVSFDEQDIETEEYSF